MAISKRDKQEYLKKCNKTLDTIRPSNSDEAQALSNLLHQLVNLVSSNNPKHDLESIQSDAGNHSNAASVIELFFKPTIISNNDYGEYLKILSDASGSTIKRLDLIEEISQSGFPIEKINQMESVDLESFVEKLDLLVDAGIPLKDLILLDVETIHQLSAHDKLTAQLISNNVALPEIVNLDPQLFTEFSHHLSELDSLMNELNLTLSEVVALGNEEREIFYQNRESIIKLVQDAHMSFEYILPAIMAMDESKKNFIQGGNLDILIEMINDSHIPYQTLLSLDISKLEMIVEHAYTFNKIIQSGIPFSQLIESPSFETLLESGAVLKLAENNLGVSLTVLESLTTEKEKIIGENFHALNYLVLDKELSANEILQCEPQLLKAILKNPDNTVELIDHGLSLRDLKNLGPEKAMLVIENSDNAVDLLKKNTNILKQPIEFLQAMLDKTSVHETKNSESKENTSSLDNRTLK